MKISHRSTLLIAFVAAVFSGTVLWGIAKRQAVGTDETTARSAPSSQYEQLLSAQQAQNARLDRLEAMLGGIAEAAGVPLPSVGSQRAKEPDDKELTPQEREANLAKAMADAEAGFNSEPVSTAWSTRNEKIIADAFSAENLASKNSPAPRMRETSCRSRTCRIEMVYANEAQAEEGQLFLLSDIGRDFGRSRPFQRVLPDGSVQLIMYATAGTPPSAKGP